MDFFVRVGERSDAMAVAHLDIVNSNGDILATKTLTGADFDIKNEFKRFTVPFRVYRNQQIITSRVILSGGQGFCLQGSRLLICPEGCEPPEISFIGTQ